MNDKPILHVCHIDQGGPPFHPCKRVEGALNDAGVDHDRHVFDRNRPAGLFTTGKRPELKALSGQEKLPVLELPDGSTVNGSSDIIAWAQSQAA